MAITQKEEFMLTHKWLNRPMVDESIDHLRVIESLLDKLEIIEDTTEVSNNVRKFNINLNYEWFKQLYPLIDLKLRETIGMLDYYNLMPIPTFLHDKEKEITLYIVRTENSSINKLHRDKILVPFITN